MTSFKLKYLFITGQILRKAMWKVIKLETRINNKSVLICLLLQRISTTYNDLYSTELYLIL